MSQFDVPRPPRAGRWLAIGVVLVLGPVAAAAALLALATWLGVFPPPTVVGRDEIAPLPAPLREVYDGTYPCRGSGDIGWEYRYFVIQGDDGQPGGVLDRHLRSLGFEVETIADEWRVLRAERSGIVVELGSLESLQAGRRRVTRGPLSFEVERAVGQTTGPLAVLELYPEDEQCEV